MAILTCMILTSNIETPAFLPPYLLDRLLTRVKKLNSLVLYHTITWCLFATVIQMTIPYLVLITFALVSLQGTCSYVVYGLTDTELFKACYRNRRNQQKQENTKEGDETLSINPPIKSKLSKYNQSGRDDSQQEYSRPDDNEVFQRNKTTYKNFE
ncbi:unnamed protein product [Heterobilharzia americana]|nr:unnamed protein product [Heterobilharzia americana]